MTILRMLIVAVVIALGTVRAGWWVVPAIGAVYGVLARGTRQPALLAAAGGALAWGGLPRDRRRQRRPGHQIRVFTRLGDATPCLGADRGHAGFPRAARRTRIVCGSPAGRSLS